MTRFRYKGRNPQGAPVTGTMEAEHPEAVALRLSQAGVVPVTITRDRFRLSVKTLQVRKERVRPEELIFFSRQLATILRVGITLTEALAILRRETQNRTLRAALDAIQRDLEGGSSLSDALAHHPRIFSEIYIHTVDAAEAGGFLDQALTRLATWLENQLDTRRRVTAAIRYPLFVLLALGIGVIILVTFVIPQFAQLYSAFHASLPLPTRMVLALGTMVHAAWPALLGGAMIIAIGVRWALQRPWGRRIWDDWKLKIPIAGPLVLKLTLARLAHILGTLTASGIPLVRALDITSRAIGNTTVAREIGRVRRAVEGGRSFAEPLSQISLFPPLLAEMVAVGEKTGELDTLLPTIAEHYDAETSYTIRTLPTIIEPILLVVVATLVLFLALAVFLPLWDMAKLIRR